MKQEQSPGRYDRSNDKRYNYFNGQKNTANGPYDSRKSNDGSPVRSPIRNSQDFDIQHYSPKSPAMKTRLSQNFTVIFKMKFVTVPGEDLYIIGDLPQLGGNKDLKYPLKWTDGHIWVSETPLVTSTPYFAYKYVMVDQKKGNKITDQEDGIQRVADLTLLHNQGQASIDKGLSPRLIRRSSDISNQVEINDMWQAFKIQFTTFHPLLSNNQVLKIHGHKDQFENGSIQMKKVNMSTPWMIQKYGEKVQPYEITVDFKNESRDHQGKPLVIEYFYSYCQNSRNQMEVEREPYRVIEVHHPNTYQGQSGFDEFGSKKHVYQKEAWITNGCIQRCDGNFLKNFAIKQIDNSNIFMGPYPVMEEDVMALKDQGITAILNLQTQEDIADRGYSWSRLTQLYLSKGIKTAIHFPVDEYNEKEHKMKVFAAAQYLNDMANNKGHRVYIHCSSGITRAPSVVLTYFCLFKRVESWRDIEKADNYLTSHYRVCHSNKTVVSQIIRDNHEFQSKQVDEWEIRKVEPIKSGRINPILQKLLDEEKIRIEADRKWREECELTRKKWDLQATQYEQEQTRKVNNYSKQIEDEYNRSMRDLDSTETDMKNQIIKLETQLTEVQHDLEERRKLELGELQVDQEQAELQLQMALEIKRKNELERERINQELKQFLSNSEQEMNDSRREQQYIIDQTVEWDKEYKRRSQQIVYDADHEKELLTRKYTDAQKIIAEENERIRQERIMKGGFTDEEIDQQCDELFRETPIRFKPRKGNQVDQNIENIIQAYDVRIPIVQDNKNEKMYLIGTQKLPCSLRQDNVLVRVGGGSDKLDDYIKHNHRTFERMLVIHMINSNQSLEWVVDQLMQGNKIKGSLIQSNMNQPRASTSVSPIRKPGISPTRGGRLLENQSPVRQAMGSSLQGIAPYNRTKSPKGVGFR